MKELINSFIRFAFIAHEKILTLNDSYEARFTDVELHFIVFGLGGVALFALSFVVFKALRKHIGCSAWLITFFIVLLLALAVEVGQDLSGTGAMELNDILWGVSGYVCISAIAVAAIGVFRAIRKNTRRPDRKRKQRT